MQVEILLCTAGFFGLAFPLLLLLLLPLVVVVVDFCTSRHPPHLRVYLCEHWGARKRKKETQGALDGPTDWWTE